MKITLIMVCAVLATAMAGAVSRESKAQDVDAAGSDLLAVGKDVVGEAGVMETHEERVAVAHGSAREGVMRATAYSGTGKGRVHRESRSLRAGRAFEA